MTRVDRYDILSQETIDDPYPFYRWLREEAPVYEVPGTEVFLVSKRSLIEEVLNREEEFSANLTGVLISDAEGAAQVFDLSAFGGTVDAIANADEPSHAVHRKLILPHVTPSRTASLESLIRDWAEELMAPLFEAGGGDWIAAVANPLPARATALVVGLPLEDVDQLLDWAMAGTEVLAGSTTLDRMMAVAQKAGKMVEYLNHHLERALAAPVQEPVRGIIGELARGVRESLISADDAVSILVVLVGAGAESTSSLTGNAIRILAEQPELQAELRAHPSLIPSFVEEAVRLESPFRGHYRAVRKAALLGGTELPAGSRLILMWAAANRDAADFVNPDAVDLHRKNARDHLAFGRASHFCVGARLARLEARVIVEEVLAGSGGFALRAGRPPQRVSSIFVRRHHDLELVIHR